MPTNHSTNLTPLFNRIQDSTKLSTADAYILASAFVALTEMDSILRKYKFGAVLDDALEAYPAT